MRASRLLSILILLQMRGRLSAEALAKEFEVSVRTIYRDIDQLSAAGVPVYGERGRAGGFALMDGYRTRLTGLTPSEAEALVLSGAGPAAADLGLGDDLMAGRLKLLAGLSPDAGAGAQKVAARFHLDPVNWYRRGDRVEVLPRLSEAVWTDRRIRIAYDSWKGAVDRTLDPLGLVLKGGAWYLVAAAEGRPRAYRASNIRSLQVLDEVAVRPPSFDLANYWADWSRDFEARLLAGRATIRLSQTGLRRLRDHSPAAAEAVDRTAPSPGTDWIEAEIPIESVDDAVGLLMRLGREVEVLGPPELRAAIQAELAAVAALYRA